MVVDAEPRWGPEGDGACGRGGGARRLPAITKRDPYLRGLSTGRRWALEWRALNGPIPLSAIAAFGDAIALCGPNIAPE